MKTTTAVAIAMILAEAVLHAHRLGNGLEFRTPTGWTVKSNQQAAVLTPPDGSNDEFYVVAMLPGVKDLQDPQLAAIVRGQYFPAEAQVRTAGVPQPFRAATGIGYIHRLDAVSQGVALRVLIYVAAMPGGGGVAGVMAIGRPPLVERREAIVAGVAASLSKQIMSNPAPSNQPSSNWEQRLSGHKLYQFSSYSSSYGSGGYNSQKTLLLRTDGTYEFHRAGSVSVYVPGANGGSASQGGDQGRWRIVEQGSNSVLELMSAKGTTENITLTANGTKTFLNGQRWLVGN